MFCISSRLGAALLGLLLSWFGLPAVRAASMQTILTNGPISNRFNIVVLSEGYTSKDLAHFAFDVTNAINALLAQQPYAEYSNYFNAFAISVPSNESGSDHPSWPVYHDTYFNSTYDSINDFLITMPTNSTGQGKVDALLQTFMPECHLPVLLVNDPILGGSDGFAQTAIVALCPSTAVQWPILMHESGHVVANLGDEYTNAYPGFPDIEEPNTTRSNQLALIKWKAWIPTGTPMPTPATSQYSSIIGLFQGAHYHTTGWYRPKVDCAMNHLGVPFCDVCSETMVLSFYRKLRPVDGFIPASTNVSAMTTQALTFNLNLLQPTTHNLAVQWSTNGTAVPGATNAALVISPQWLRSGSNQVAALVSDPTALVRNDPTNLLRQTVAWSVNVNIQQLVLDSSRWLSGGKFAFRVSGMAPQGFVLYGSTNFSTWAPLTTNSLAAGQFWYTNTGAGAFAKRFFRASSPP